MTNKWYKDVKGSLDDSILIYDTSALLNVYRYSLVSSKKMLKYLMKYEGKIQIPYLVRKEFYTNKEKVRTLNLYKNIEKTLVRQVERKRDELFSGLKDYERKRLHKFTYLQDKLKLKFEEMNQIIKTYKDEIVEEASVYKDFITEEVDVYLNTLLESDKVWDEINTVELIEILKEGDIRYRYQIPPGYEDEKDKKGINKFGDLIIWKQLISYSKIQKQKNIIFVTSDIKNDWFELDDKKEIVRPRKELISEFNYFNPNKNIVILPFEIFIEEIADSSDPSDTELLLEVRMGNLIKRLNINPLQNIIWSKIDEIDKKVILEKTFQDSTEWDNYFLSNTEDVYVYDVEIKSVNGTGIKIREEDNEVIYSLSVIAECTFNANSENDDILTNGTIYAEILFSLELVRKLGDSEETFLQKFEDSSSIITSMSYYVVEKAEYTWGNDYHLDGTGDKI